MAMSALAEQRAGGSREEATVGKPLQDRLEEVEPALHGLLTVGRIAGNGDVADVCAATKIAGLLSPNSKSATIETWKRKTPRMASPRSASRPARRVRLPPAA